MLTVCSINRQPGSGYHYSDTNACGESAASNKCSQELAGLMALNVCISVGAELRVTLMTFLL